MTTLAPERPITSSQFQPTPAEVDYCSRFADFDVVVLMTGNGVRTWVDDGQQVLGDIRICEECRQFRIILFRATTETDMRAMENGVANIKAGHFNRFTWAKAAENKTGHTMLRSSLMVRRAEQDLADRHLTPCTERACVDFGKIHTCDDPDGAEGVFHKAQSFTCEQYTVTLERVDAKPWSVCVERCDDLAPEGAASLISDLQWVTAECRKLNEKAEVCS
jgi:hypothetical protein